MRKTLQSVLLLVAVLMCLSIFAACGSKIESIRVEKAPNKTEYLVGDSTLDLTGGSIEVTYDKGDPKSIQMTNSRVSAKGFDSSKAGEVTITVTYSGKSTTFNVTIVEAEVPEKKPTRIEVVSEPLLTDYIIGDKFNPEGGMLKLHYDDDSYDSVSMEDDDVSFEYEFNAVGEATVTISYLGFEAEITVNVGHGYESYDWTEYVALIADAEDMIERKSDLAFLHTYYLLISEMDVVFANPALRVAFDEHFGNRFDLLEQKYCEIYQPVFDETEDFMRAFSRTVYMNETTSGYSYTDDFKSSMYNVMILYSQLTIEQVARIMIPVKGAFHFFTNFSAWYMRRMTYAYDDFQMNCYFSIIQSELFYAGYITFGEEYSYYLDGFRDAMRDAINSYEEIETYDPYFAGYFGSLYNYYLGIYYSYFPAPEGYDWAYMRYLIRESKKIAYNNICFYYFYYEINAQIDYINSNCSEDIIDYLNDEHGGFFVLLEDYFATIYAFVPDLFEDEQALEFLKLFAINSYFYDYEMGFAYQSWLNEDVELMMDMYWELSDVQIYQFIYLLNTNFEFMFSEITVSYFRQWVAQNEGLVYYVLIKADIRYKYYIFSGDEKGGLNEGFIYFMRVCVETYYPLIENTDRFNEFFGELFNYYVEIYYTYVPTGLEGFNNTINLANSQYSGGYVIGFMYYYLRLMEQVNELLESGNDYLIEAYQRVYGSRVASLTTLYNNTSKGYDAFEDEAFQEFLYVFSEGGFLFYNSWIYMLPEIPEMSIVENILAMYNDLTLAQKACIAAMYGAKGALEQLSKYYYINLGFSTAEADVFFYLIRAEIAYANYITREITDSTGLNGFKSAMENAMSRYNALGDKTKFNDAFGEFYTTYVNAYNLLFP